MLDNFENRWSFACSFGAITNVLVSLLMGQQAYTTQAESLLLKCKFTTFKVLFVNLLAYFGLDKL